MFFLAIANRLAARKPVEAASQNIKSATGFYSLPSCLRWQLLCVCCCFDVKKILGAQPHTELKQLEYLCQVPSKSAQFNKSGGGVVLSQHQFCNLPFDWKKGWVSWHEEIIWWISHIGNSIFLFVTKISLTNLLKCSVSENLCLILHEFWRSPLLD